MLKNLHRPKKGVIFTLVKGDTIYHTIPNGKTGNTYIYRRKKEKPLPTASDAPAEQFHDTPRKTPSYAVKTRNNNTTGQHTSKTNFQPSSKPQITNPKSMLSPSQHR